MGERIGRWPLYLNHGSMAMEGSKDLRASNHSLIRLTNPTIGLDSDGSILIFISYRLQCFRSGRLVGGFLAGGGLGVGAGFL